MACPPVAQDETLIVEARARLLANLTALEIHQPELAAELARARLPEGAGVVCGRDGSPAGLLGDDGECVHWLGGTSMPSVSSSEVLRGAVEAGASVALASVGSGYEPLLLAERLAPHAAVFVCAAEPAHLVLALHAADWSRELRRGRIVVLAGDIETSLAEFIETHPGYQVPTRVQPLPEVNRAALEARAAAVQRGAQRADAAQQRMVARIAEQVVRRRGRKQSVRPRALILSIDAVGGAIEFAAHADNALVALGFSVARCVPDAPEKCHRLARLAALRDHDPDWVLLVNCTPGPLADCWPADLPYACWFLESASLPANALVGLNACGNLFAASETVGQQLLARGAAVDCVEVLEPGVDDTVFRPLRPGNDERIECDVAVMQDVCDLAPAAAGIGLESHERLWAAAAKACAASLRKGDTLDAEALLAGAERATGVKLTDAKLRAEFRTLVAGRLMPTVRAREIAAGLRRAGSVGLWGAGWEKQGELSGLHRGPLPPPAARNRLYQQVGVVVIPDRGPVGVRTALEVLAAGGRPVVAEFAADDLARYPRSCQVLSRTPSFRGVPDAVRSVRGLLGDTACRRGRSGQAEGGKRDRATGSAAVQAAREELLARHTLRDRLRELYEHVTTRAI